jgi:omega-hydroxy-beta-dihydromenaquinone-9 sulfotransferase
MHVCYRLFVKAMWQTLTGKPRRLGNLLTIGAVTAGFAAYESVLAACLLLDRLLFPGFARTEVREPLFIVGNPRSGTSFLYRLLALDEESFTAFRLRDIVCPSLVQQRLLSVAAGVDRALGSPLGRTWTRWEDRFTAASDDVRRTRWNEPEEDDLVLIHKFACASLLMMFPHATVLAPLARHDDLPPRLRGKLDRFYADCIRRLLYHDRAHRRLLSKNVTFPAKVRSMAETFPDARFVYLIRNPVVSIASTQSMFDKASPTTLSTRARAERGRWLFETACYFYTHALAELGRLPRDRWCSVNYEDLIRDPEQTVRTVYAALGLAVSPTFAARLRAAASQAASFTSRHSYASGQGGVTEDDVRAALPDVYARFSFRERVRRASGPGATPGGGEHHAVADGGGAR